MRIIENTDNFLNIEVSKFNYFARLGNTLLVWGIPILMGVTFIIIMGKLHTLKCERLEPTVVNCTLNRSSLIGKKTISINRLEKAELKENKGDDGTTYHINLVTNNQVIPFTDYSSSGKKGKQNKINKINNFLHNSQEQYLIVQQDDRIFAYLIGGLSIIMGLSVLYGFGNKFEPVNYILDKNQDKFLIKEQNLLTTKFTHEDKLSDLDFAQYKQLESSEDVISYQLSLVKKTGTNIKLNCQEDKSEYEEITKQINKFLKQ